MKQSLLNFVKVIFLLLAMLAVGSLFSGVAFAAPVPVFVSIAPEKWLVEQVGGSLVQCRVLVDRGREPHDFEPTPRQIAALYRARVYFTVGMEFEQQLIKRISGSRAGVRIVDVTTGVDRIPMKGMVGHDHRAGLDPHVWLAPANLKIMAAAMARTLSKLDPEHGDQYTRNLAELDGRLERLDSEIRRMLLPWQGATFFVYHPAFGYFAHAYGLRQEAVEVAGKSPSPRQLAGLIDRAKKEKVRVIFVQPGFAAKSAAAVARAIGGRVVPLDPLAEDVAANLKTMAREIKAALGNRRN